MEYVDSVLCCFVLFVGFSFLSQERFTKIYRRFEQERLKNKIP